MAGGTAPQSVHVVPGRASSRPGRQGGMNVQANTEHMVLVLVLVEVGVLLWGRKYFKTAHGG